MNMEATGFKCWGEPLFVGDVVCHYHGYMGHMEVVKREDGYWMTDYDALHSNNEADIDGLNPDFPLDEDLPHHFNKVDRNDPIGDTSRKYHMADEHPDENGTGCELNRD
jgi:hypothetical protein